jgi:hypothetical protein
MTNYSRSQPISGIDENGELKTIRVNSDGFLSTSTPMDTVSVNFGTKIDDATIPTGGEGNLGWLSAIWKLITDRLPTLVGGKIPVDVASLNVTVDNANLEISNDVGNPIPVSGTFWQATQPVSATSLPLPSGAATSALQSTSNTSLANIDTKTPALGQALASASTPVVLPATQITALTPPTSVGISGTLPAFATTPTVNIGTAPSLTFTNTSFTANAGTNLNTSALALESGGNLTSINNKLPSNLTVSATRLLVDGSGVTQPVSMAVAPAGLAYLSTTTITRAANTTPYTANDVYGSAFELTNIGASGGFIFLNSLDIIFNITSLPSGMGSFAIYLYSSPPPSAITDNLPYSLNSGDRSSILNPNGFNLFASLARGGGSVVAESFSINQLFKLAPGSTSLWGYLVTLGAFTPAANSETATIRARSFAP